ncbi:hypothetical protein [Haloferax sp. KTX1]|uniref:hypothetical protein n=1 Tax=Haloferax sp. KTX1 TaxID=2600597 RepID=UPI0011DD8D09|nr:hypothetical protein [Haloferax sp. KTX1]
MEKIQRWVEKIHERRIEKQYDAIVLVIAEEGDGKSTLMNQLTWLWQDVRGLDPTPESVLDRVVWGERDEFKRTMATAPERSAIPVMDAARALYKRDAMDSEQKDAEKDLLDVRTSEYFIMLGYQGYDDIPTTLAKRRALAALKIPRNQRGKLRGYSRESLDEKWETGEWPEPDMRDTFPSLEGTELWEVFKRRDKKRKAERINPDDDEEESELDLDPRELAQEIVDEGVGRVVSIHGGNKQPYIASELIEVHYGASMRNAKKVKLILENRPDVDLERFAEEA